MFKRTVFLSYLIKCFFSIIFYTSVMRPVLDISLLLLLNYWLFSLAPWSGGNGAHSSEEGTETSRVSGPAGMGQTLSSRAAIPTQVCPTWSTAPSVNHTAALRRNEKSFRESFFSKRKESSCQGNKTLNFKINHVLSDLLTLENCISRPLLLT